MSIGGRSIRRTILKRSPPGSEFTEFIPDVGTTRVARTEAEIDPIYGAGVQVQFAQIGARLEWERLENVDEGIGGREGRDIDYISAGVVFRF